MTQSNHIKLHINKGDSGFGSLSKETWKKIVETKRENGVYDRLSESTSRRNKKPTEAMLKQRVEFTKRGVETFLEMNVSKKKRKLLSRAMKSDASHKQCSYCGRSGFSSNASLAGHSSHCKYS